MKTKKKPLTLTEKILQAIKDNKEIRDHKKEISRRVNNRKNEKTRTIEKTKTVFISGKVKGEDYQKCFDKFLAVENLLFTASYNVINPLRIVPRGTSWIDAIDILRPHLINSDIILFLTDWQNSKGSKLERKWAKHYKKQIVEFTQLHDVLLYPMKDAT